VETAAIAGNEKYLKNHAEKGESRASGTLATAAPQTTAINHIQKLSMAG